MRTRRLGRSDLEVTVAGFGAWAAGGGGWQFGWGTQDDADSIAAIHRALELGVNWVDTAAAYGFGHSEEVVGLALRGLAERPYVFTKCALLEGPGRQVLHNLSRDSLRSECEASLRRLGVEAIDLYQIHWPIADEDVEEGWAALAELKAEGKVRHIGVSNFDVGQLQRAEAIAPVESLQPPYSLLERGIEDELLPWCAEHDTGVIVYSPMGSGLLTGAMTRERVDALPEDDWRRTSPAFREPALSRNLELADRLREIAERHGVFPGAVAVAWTLRRPEVTGAIVGFRRPDQVDGVLPAAAELELSDDELAQLDDS
jgi:aryl-alcohol dehydrogenase-like predicted oxidoreductase